MNSFLFRGSLCSSKVFNQLDEVHHIIKSNLLSSKSIDLSITRAQKISLQKHPEYLNKYLGTVAQLS